MTECIWTPYMKWKISDPNTYNTRQGRRDRKGEKVQFTRKFKNTLMSSRGMIKIRQNQTCEIQEKSADPNSASFQG